MAGFVESLATDLAEIDALRAKVAELRGQLLVNIWRGKELVRQVRLDDPRAGYCDEFNRQGKPFGLRAEAA